MEKPKWCPKETWDKMTDAQKAGCIANPAAAAQMLNLDVNADLDTSSGDNGNANDDDSGDAGVSVTADPDIVVNAAATLGEKVTDALRGVIAATVDLQQKAKQGRLVVWVAFQKAYDKSLSALPYAGRVYVEGSNEPFDILKRDIPKKRGKGTVEVEFSVLNDLHDKFVNPDLIKAIRAIEDLPKEQRNVAKDAELDNLRQRRLLGRNMVYEAVEFGKQWALFQELPYVGVRFCPDISLPAGEGVMDKDGYVDFSKVAKGNNCLSLFTKLKDGGEADHRITSVGAFIGLKPLVAIDKAGGKDKVSLTNILDTSPRKTPPDAGTPGAGDRTNAGQGNTGASAEGDDIVIKNNPQIDSALASIAAMFEDGEDWNSFSSYAIKKDKDGNYVQLDMVGSMKIIRDTIDRFFNTKEGKAMLAAHAEAKLNGNVKKDAA